MARPSALVDVELDPEQRRAVELPPGRALLVLGEAGHGKTTVALRRLAALAERAPGRFRAAVIVPSEGLRRLLERSLVRRGVAVPAFTFDAFARRQARRVFPDLPRRESADASAATIRLKRDPALCVVLDELAAKAPAALDEDDVAGPARSPAYATRADLLQLFGDRRLLERVVSAARGGLPAHALEECLEHTRIQFSARSERSWSHVSDRQRLVALDGLALDAGTPHGDAHSVDVEDYALLFELDRRRARRLGRKPSRPRRYDCLVVDEAQELAPLELRLIARSLARGGSLIVAGDADQQQDEGAAFRGWDATLRALGSPDHERVVLEIGYRCAPAVADLARHVLGRGSKGVRSARVFCAATDAARRAWLLETLSRLLKRGARSSIGVITRSPLEARRLWTVIRASWPARLVLDGEFRFGSGIDVSVADQVRGIEFDQVLIPDASADVYPDDAHSRRTLYVAITRARTAVHFAAPGAPTPLLR